MLIPRIGDGAVEKIPIAGPPWIRRVFEYVGKVIPLSPGPWTDRTEYGRWPAGNSDRHTFACLSPAH
jgi:hypothetical protein